MKSVSSQGQQCEDYFKNLHASQIYFYMGEATELPLPYKDYLTNYFYHKEKHKNTYSAKVSLYLKTSFVLF